MDCSPWRPEPGHEGEFDVGPQLDQTQFADLGKGPVATRPGGGPAEGRGIGLGVGNVVDDAIEPHQAESAVEGPRRFGPSQGTNDLLKKVADRSNAQTLPGHARLDQWGGCSPKRSRRRCLKTWRIGNSVNSPMARTTQQTTSWVSLQQRCLVRPAAARAWRTASRGNNLFQSCQSVQDPARLIGRQRALSLWHASLGLLVAWVLSKNLSKPKISRRSISVRS